MSKLFAVVKPAVLVIAGLLSALSSQAQKPSDIPVADFFRRPAVSAPQLSPGGRQIAMLVRSAEGRTVLAVADVATPERRIGVARFDDADVSSFSWVNDKRLVFMAVDLQSPLGQQVGSGLYAVNADGSDFVWLVGRQGYDEAGAGHVANRPLRWNHVFRRTLGGQTDDVVVERFNLRRASEPQSSTMMRLNTFTRATKALLDDEPPNATGWIFDQQQRPRAAISLDLEGNASVMWRPVDGPWKSLQSFNVYRPAPGQIEPVAFDAQGQLLVRAVRNDEARTSALFRYSPEQGKLADKPMVSMEGFDFDGTPVFDSEGKRDLLGLHFLTDAAGSVWFDDKMKALQERVDKVLPQTINRISCSRCVSAKHLVVTSFSDRQSPVYFLFDAEAQGKDSLKLIGASRPWLDAGRMATQEFERIKVRDGLSMPVYVTRPQGKGPWPTVVLVHGGPWVRGVSWGFNPGPQFLASRGYLVVEPEFRGSQGYGFKHFQASWKQWGLSMQDDITDATRWAVEKGLADPKRLVIAGASYGGYATMMGLVKEPDLYRAGINWVGVTDVGLMYSVDWSDAPDLWLRQGMPFLIGDRTKDREQLEATSPLKRAASITKPVLMAYGTKDFRVPLPHGERMRDALKAAGKVEVEWVAYENEGHGFMLESNQVDFWSRVERFLGRHVQ